MFKNRDKYVDYVCKYIQWKGDRGNEISIRNIGWQLEQASWVADIIIGLFWVLLRKKIITKAEFKEIFWHGEEE